MASSNDSYRNSDSVNNLSTFNLKSFYTDTNEEFDITRWTTAPIVNRDPSRFIDNREILVEGTQTSIEFWKCIFPENLVQTIV